MCASRYLVCINVFSQKKLRTGCVWIPSLSSEHSGEQMLWGVVITGDTSCYPCWQKFRVLSDTADHPCCPKFGAINLVSPLKALEGKLAKKEETKKKKDEQWERWSLFSAEKAKGTAVCLYREGMIPGKKRYRQQRSRISESYDVMGCCKRGTVRPVKVRISKIAAKRFLYRSLWAQIFEK